MPTPKLLVRGPFTVRATLLSTFLSVLALMVVLATFGSAKDQQPTKHQKRAHNAKTSQSESAKTTPIAKNRFANPEAEMTIDDRDKRGLHSDDNPNAAEFRLRNVVRNDLRGGANQQSGHEAGHGSEIQRGKLPCRPSV